MRTFQQEDISYLEAVLQESAVRSNPVLHTKMLGLLSCAYAQYDNTAKAQVYLANAQQVLAVVAQHMTELSNDYRTCTNVVHQAQCLLGIAADVPFGLSYQV